MMKTSFKWPSARFLSFIALFCLNQIIYLAVILNSFSAPAPRGLILESGIFSFMGMALSSFLCPLFLPTEHCRKNLSSGILFISAIILPNFILRSLGAELFSSSASIRAVTMFLSGMMYTFTFGLFFLTHLQPQVKGSGENRLSRYCTILFSLVIAAGIIVSHFALSLLNLSGLSREPIKAMSVVFNIIKWLFVVVGAASIAALILRNKEKLNVKPPARQNRAVKTVSPELKTNLSIILRLIGLSVVHKALNGIMNFRLFSVLNYLPVEFNSYPLIIAAAIILITLLTGRSTISFIKWFLPLSISLFILLPSLILFGAYSPFVFFINVVIGTFSNLLWIFFSAALVEYYIPNRPEKSRFSGFWVYGLSVMMFFTNVFSFAIPMFSRNIPPNLEYTILIAAIAAITFFFLSFRILFPKNPPIIATAHLYKEKRSREKRSKERAIVIPPDELGNLVGIINDGIINDGIINDGIINDGIKNDVIIKDSTKNDVIIYDVYKKHKLTKRELEVANLLAYEGLGAKAIANRLCISFHTVNDHIASIYKKFKVKSRGAFMAAALKNKT